MIILSTSTPYDARFSQLYFGQSLHTLQFRLPAIADLTWNLGICLMLYAIVMGQIKKVVNRDFIRVDVR